MFREASSRTVVGDITDSADWTGRVTDEWHAFEPQVPDFDSRRIRMRGIESNLNQRLNAIENAELGTVGDCVFQASLAPLDQKTLSMFASDHDWDAESKLLSKHNR